MCIEHDRAEEVDSVSIGISNRTTFTDFNRSTSSTLSKLPNVCDVTSTNQSSIGVLENFDDSAYSLLDNSIEQTDKMPVISASEDLLSWCKKVTQSYQGVKVTNLTTSWKNGLAFCAIIHNFRPDLINLNSLSASDIVGNNKLAFETGAKLGIPKLIKSSDMLLEDVPDKLSVMTYLYQMHAYFTGQMMPDSFSSLKNSASLLSPSSSSSSSTSLSSHSSHSKRLHNDFIGSCSMHSGLYKMAQPVEIAPGLWDVSPTKPMRLPRAYSAPNGHLLFIDPRKRPPSREEELKQRARKLLEEARKETFINGNNGKPKHQLSEQEAEREKQLRERARQLIAEAKQGMTWSCLNSPTSPVGSFNINNHFSNYNFNLTSCHTNDNGVQQFQSKGSEINGNDQESDNEDEEYDDFDMRMLNNLNNMKKHSNDQSYIGHAFESLEREEEELDEEAERLEKRLRKAMEGGDKQEEEFFLKKWFALVDKRNAIIRREMQLNIIEKEAELERRFNLLKKELKNSLSIEESKKTLILKQREKLLLEGLLKIVNKRDQLVQHIDNQQKV